MKAGVVMEHPDVDTEQHLAIPETLDFHAEGKGAVPVRLHLRPKEFWLLRNLYVQELRFTRQISTEAGAIAFISTIKKGTVTLHDVAESITLQENEPLTLTGVRGRLVELRGDDTFTLQFEGTCTETLHWSCRRPGESCSLPAEILLSPGATDVFLECRGVHLGHTMEYSQNGLSLRRLRWLAALVVSLSIMVPSAIQAQQAAGETLSLALRSNVVSIVAERSDGIQNGFGFIVGERHGQVYIVTANHVVRSSGPDATSRIFIKYFHEQGKAYQATLLETSHQAYDLAVLQARVPTGLAWQRNALGLQKGEL